ncbi:MAG: hypothetical protein EBR95_03605 [Verrucomicrobia bacterium]|nr:hypothetical protein [Verrucomicrobiota bacterium]
MGALSTFRNLAGGRLPPLTRTALLCGLSVFIGALVFFSPGAGGQQPAQPLTQGVRLVPPGDARTESVVLLDSSAVYLPAPARLTKAARGEVGQPEDAPFAAFAPILQFDPAKPLGKESMLKVPRQVVPDAALAIPLAAQEPLTTFGSAGFRDVKLEPRTAFFEVYPLQGGYKSVISGKIEHFIVNKDNKSDKSDKNAPLNGYFEVILSVDSLGQAPLGSVLRFSGSKPMDEAVQRWAASVEWGKRLTPGVYRLIVGP